MCDQRVAHVTVWAVLITTMLALAPTPAAARFSVGLQDGATAEGASAAQINAANGALDSVSASFVRIPVDWAGVAPRSSRRAGVDPAQPDDPDYDWQSVDAGIRLASEHHLQVILTFNDAPGWAQGPGRVKPYVTAGAWNPNPTAFAAFLHAAAVRYSGSYPNPQNPGSTLPRVKYWEPWNEPNIPGYFSAPHPVSAYRTLLNDAYNTLKAVHRDNEVIFGGLAPVSPVPGSIPPLNFAAQLLCLHHVGSGFAPNRSCRQRVKFDTFGMHPYAFAATPTKHAYKPGDVLVGDMGEVHALVSATNRYHTAIPASGHPLWVTEFDWFTNPPNKILGDSQTTAARYVAYSMYEMWKAGVSLVIWLGILDDPGHDISTGAGLFTASGQPKLTLQAFAFPVIASVSRGQGYVWGRVPVSHSVRVLVERAAGPGWRNIKAVSTGSDGVFQAFFKARSNGVYRAQVVGGPTSLPYDSRPIPPRRTHLLNLFS